MALDQGTTSSRTIIFDKTGNIVSKAQKEFQQIYPKPGYVEHDPMEIWATQYGTAKEALEIAGIKGDEIAAIGIGNQRETTIVWNKATGKPIYNAISSRYFKHDSRKAKGHRDNGIGGSLLGWFGDWILERQK